MPNKIKIISYNICGLPRWYNLFGDPYDRIDKIADFLIKTDADVICLQEVFDSGLIIILKTKLSDYNYYSSDQRSTRPAYTHARNYFVTTVYYKECSYS